MSKKGRISIALLALCLICSFCFVACENQNNNQDKDSSVNVNEGKENDNNDKKPVKLKLICSSTEENRTKDYRVEALYASVEKINEDEFIEMEIEGISHDTYHEKAQILAAGNELPDIIDVKGSWVGNWVESKRLYNLNPILNDDKEWKEKIKLEVFDNFRVDDGLYAMSLEGPIPTHIIFYNEEILEECGYSEFPKTYDELKKAIVAIKEKGYTPMSMGNKGKWLAESCYLSTIGARFTTEDWNQSIINGKGAKFTDKEFIEALELFQEMASLGAFNEDLNSVEYAQQRVPYYNKEAAMFVEGFWAVKSVIQDAPEDVLENTKVARFPDINKAGNDKLVSAAVGWGYGLNQSLSNDSDKLDAATKWLKTYFTTQNANEYASRALIPAMNTTDVDQSNLLDLQLEALEYGADLLPCTIYDSSFDGAIIDVMNSGLQELLIDSITPEKLAERIQRAYEDTLE